MRMLFIIVTLMVTPVWANDTSSSFIIENVLLPDFEANELRPVSIEVKDGVFQRIWDSEHRSSHTDIRDGKGQVIMPALIDMHSHSMGNSSLDRSDYQYIGIRGTANAMLYAGIHGWLDLFSDESDIFGYRDRVFAYTRNEAYVFAAGPCFTVPTGHCDFGGTRLINTPAEAVAELRDLQQSQPNVAKIVYDTGGSQPTVSPETLQAFLQEANRLGIKSVVHIGTWDDLRTAAELGADAITHLPLDAMPEDIPQHMAAHHVAFIPTVAVINELMLLHQPSDSDYANSVLNVAMTDALVKRKLLRAYPVTSKHPRHDEWLTRLANDEAARHRSEAISALATAGVTILVGSDAGNFAVFQGVGMHREMYFLQQMGLSSWAILQSASTGAYEFLDLDWGIEPGKPAHFTLHDARIFDDLSYSTQVTDVYLHGRLVDRNEMLRYAKPGFFQYMKLFFGFEV